MFWTKIYPIIVRFGRFNFILVFTSAEMLTLDNCTVFSSGPEIFIISENPWSDILKHHSKLSFSIFVNLFCKAWNPSPVILEPVTSKEVSWVPHIAIILNKPLSVNEQKFKERCWICWAELTCSFRDSPVMRLALYKLTLVRHSAVRRVWRPISVMFKESR